MFLLLGTNLGDRKKNLAVARSGIELSIGRILKASSLYRTAAWGKTDQPEFINQALEVETTHSPERVLGEILRLEQTLGRERNEKWGERIIDIDILLYGKENIDTAQLTIPHAELAKRKFALEQFGEARPRRVPNYRLRAVPESQHFGHWAHFLRNFHHPPDPRCQSPVEGSRQRDP